MDKHFSWLLLAGLLLVNLVPSRSVASLSTPAERSLNAAPVDGGWSYWYWPPCTKGCRDVEGPGIRQLIRVCNNPAPQDGGAECRRHDDTLTTPSDRVEIDLSVNSGQGYIECNRSDCSPEALDDSTSPTTPQNLQATVLSDSKVRLHWEHATDDVEVVQYRIYDQRDFVVGVSKETYYTPPGYQTNVYTACLLTPATTYSFDVTALDERGNESAHSSAVTVTTRSFQHDDTLINPFRDIVYRGAFELPGPSGSLEYGRWGYGGYGLAYYPLGDPGGSADGYPGSLFGRGHVYDWAMSEISIPEPVVSPDKDRDDLNIATTLQPFTQVYTLGNDLSMPIGGMAYLPRQGGQTSDKLYTIWGSNYNWEKIPSHTASELTLDDPQTQGWWYVGDRDGHPPYYSTAFYLFDIPQAWADEYTGGRMLLTGGTRSGSYNGFGTAMFAIVPWLDGDPLPFEAELSYTTLVEYGQVTGVNTQDGREVKDQFHGGAWVTRGGKTAVTLVGGKAAGEVTYAGGYTSSLYWPVFLFYDPADLAAVATGSKVPHEPQPYAMLDVSEYFFSERPVLRGVAYDRARGLIYIYEHIQGDPLIHVFQVAPAPAAPTLHRPRCVIGGDTLTATLTWTPLVGTVTSTLYYSGTYFTADDLDAVQTLTDSLPASTVVYTVTLPYNEGETAFFGLRSYLEGTAWSGLSNVVFCPRQDVFLPLVKR
jgi:hypothetical protein